MGHETELSKILKIAGVEPVILDIGSSGAAQFNFSDIASCSTIIGFDADSRGQDTSFSSGFHKFHLIKKAVIFDETQDKTNFYLTNLNFCSSLLEPDLDSLKHFSFRDYFNIDKIIQVPATTINKLAQETGVTSLNWVKIDAQGADLALLRSIKSDLFTEVLVVELEPGIIDAYKGEALLAETHQFMRDAGFWPSQLNTQQYPRIRPEHFEELKQKYGDYATQVVGTVPTCAEVRYHRNINYYEAEKVHPQKIIMGLVFALIDRQPGHAFELLEVLKCRDSQISEIVETHMMTYLDNWVAGLHPAPESRPPFKPLKKIQNWLQG